MISCHNFSEEKRSFSKGAVRWKSRVMQDIRAFKTLWEVSRLLEAQGCISGHNHCSWALLWSLSHGRATKIMQDIKRTLHPEVNVNFHIWTVVF